MIFEIKCPKCGNDVSVNGGDLTVYQGDFLDAEKYPYREQCFEECDECEATFMLNIDINVSVSAGHIIENKEKEEVKNARRN